jgi:arginine/ornithine N-succinyltransferase beta subunit
MENQHRKINGYRELTQADIDLMNEIKALGPQIEAVTDKIRAHIDAQYQKAKQDAASGVDALVQNAADEHARLLAADPAKWLNWGRDSMQSNLMMLTRAVAQPTFF